MADTTFSYTPGSGGTAAIDRIASTDYPYYKIKWGVPGTVTDVTVANPLPIQGTITVNGIPTTALDRGPNPATINTLRTTIDTNQAPLTVAQGVNNGGTWMIEGKTGGTGIKVPVTIDPTQLGTLIASGVPVISGGYDWLWIAASQTNTTLPSTVTGSYLEHLDCMVNTPATSQVMIKDGSGTAREILPNAVAGGVGTYVLPLGITSKLGAWQITTAAGVTVIATFHV